MTRRFTRGKLQLAALVTAAGLLVVAATATQANTSVPAGPQAVSASDPLPGTGTGLVGACGSDISYQGWEQEPTLSVNPTNSSNLATAWIQDYDDAIVVGYSTDGGRRWTTAVPPTTPCTGGLTQFGTERGSMSALDPSLSFGPSYGAGSQGIGYLSSIVERSNHSAGAVVVNRSLDGGKTWSRPAVLDSVTDGVNYVDWSYVIADQAHPGFAYALWNKGDFTATARNQYISRTADGGVTWLPPTQVASGFLAVGGRLLILPPSATAPNGALVDIVGEVPSQPGSAEEHFVGPTTLTVRRSLDQGLTWSAPSATAVADPNFMVSSAAASTPDGSSIYACWVKADPLGFSDPNGQTSSVMYSKSTDGGSTWGSPGVIAVEPGPPEYGGNAIAAAPNLAVLSNGTVGVTFYDHRNDANNPPRITDYWFRYSRDGGTTWHEQHVAGPFDKTSAPLSFLGDFQGIAPLGGGFVTTFALSRPLAGASFALGHPPTDIFVAKVAAS